MVLGVDKTLDVLVGRRGQIGYRSDSHVEGRRVDSHEVRVDYFVIFRTFFFWRVIAETYEYISVPRTDVCSGEGYLSSELDAGVHSKG